jgi:hypothetical protein
VVLGCDWVPPNPRTEGASGEREDCLAVPSAVFIEFERARARPSPEDRPPSGTSSDSRDRVSLPGEDASWAMLKPMILPSNWLTSELARDRRREPPSLSLSSETHGSLMCSVNSERIENRDERVPPVETSLMRL